MSSTIGATIATPQVVSPLLPPFSTLIFFSLTFSQRLPPLFPYDYFLVLLDEVILTRTLYCSNAFLLLCPRAAWFFIGTLHWTHLMWPCSGDLCEELAIGEDRKKAGFCVTVRSCFMCQWSCWNLRCSTVLYSSCPAWIWKEIQLIIFLHYTLTINLKSSNSDCDLRSLTVFNPPLHSHMPV